MFPLLGDFRAQVAGNRHADDVLEFDELCGFCQRNKNKQWLWAALSRRTRQIIAYAIGGRGEKTFRRLIRKIPIEYLTCRSVSAYWKSYAMLLAKGNHRQVGKDGGQTNHVEGYWATLRARMARYARRSLSFSRKLRRRHLVTKMFMIDYNQNCLSTLFH